MQKADRFRFLPLLLAATLIVLLVGRGQRLLLAQTETAATRFAHILADSQPVLPLTPQTATPCSNGMAGAYPCDAVDLLAFLPLANIGGGSGNDVWGWTDAATGKEYALMGRSSGTSFVDISDPVNPVYLGNLPPHTSNSTWRDIKVFQNHAFIVSEASGHGMQVFDLTQLRNIPSPPVTFSESAHYDDFGSAHNLVINEDSSYAYGVGTDTCSGGLHMINIRTPLSPTSAGCFSGDGYTHDAQCVNYAGPDPDYQSAEICFNANEDTLTIVDTTVKANPVQVARQSYTGSAYAHQGWLSPDHRFFFLDDELDESSSGHNTRTYIWDVTNLDVPVLVSDYTASTAAIDHNLYVRGNLMYQANYRAGMRLLEMTQANPPVLTEVGFFDIYPVNDNPNFNGAWSVYPFFDSGVIVVSGIEQGLFVLRPDPSFLFDAALGNDSQLSALPAETITHTFTLANLGLTDTYTLTVSGNQWPVTLSAGSSVTIASGMSTTLSVLVTAVSQPGASDTFTLSAISAASGQIVQAEGSTTVSGINASGDMSATAVAGATVTFTIALTNTGPLTDTFALALSGNTWPSSSDRSAITLAPGASDAFTSS